MGVTTPTTKQAEMKKQYPWITPGSVIFVVLTLLVFIGSVVGPKDNHADADHHLPANQRVVNSEGGSAVIYKNAEAENKFFTMRDGLSKDQWWMLTPYVACIVNNGDHVVKMDDADEDTEVQVIDGKSAGCHGIMKVNNLER